MGSARACIWLKDCSGSWLRSRPTCLRYPRLFLHSWMVGAIRARGWSWVLTSSTWQPCWALVPCLQAMSGFRASRLVMNGIAGLSIIGLAGALLLGLLGPVLALLLALLIFIPYAVLMSLQPSQIQRIVPRGPLCDFLCREVTPSSDYEHENGPQSQPRSEMLAVVPALLAIIAASRGMVSSALSLADRWNINEHIVAILVLATLTGIPNMIAAIRLAKHGRGAAVVSERT